MNKKCQPMSPNVYRCHPLSGLRSHIFSCQTNYTIQVNKE
jgi:hypothetical protein